VHLNVLRVFQKKSKSGVATPKMEIGEIRRRRQLSLESPEKKI
jgi:phage-related protein